jgi:uncharacterized RDD family membrane protein YckC
MTTTDPASAPGAAGAHTGARLAGFATRSLAFAIDVLIVDAIAVGIGLAAALVAQVLSLDVSEFSSVDALLVGGGWLVLAGAYFLVFWGLSGQTPGMSFMGLRVVAAKGGRVSWPRAVRRLGWMYVCVLTLGIGFLLILVDDRRRGLHDRMARTLVIHDPGAGRGGRPWGATSNLTPP